MQPVLFTIPKVNLFGLSIGPLPIHSYGVMIIVAFLIALFIAKKRAKKFGMDPAKLSDMSFWALIVGIFGARIAFILQDLGYFLKNRDQLFSFKFAGLTSFGGVIAGLAFIALWAKRAGWPVRLVLDVIAPAGLVMHAIGRVGCLLNGCCYGGVCSTNLPWAIHIDKVPAPMHPAQIYDALMNLAAVPFVLWVEKRGQSKGQIFALALALHGLARFIYEFWRAGTEEQVTANLASSTYWGSLPITQAQAMAAGLVIVGLALYVTWRQPAHAQQELIAS